MNENLKCECKQKMYYGGRNFLLENVKKVQKDEKSRKNE